MKYVTTYDNKIMLDNFTGACYAKVSGQWVKCHNLSTAKKLIKGEKNEAKN